jgi:hypothetical protein
LPQNVKRFREIVSAKGSGMVCADGARLSQPQHARFAKQRRNVTRSVHLHSYLLRVKTPALRQKPENPRRFVFVFEEQR